MSSVAVIIPLYNKARYIKRALDSIAAQTLPVSEIIVVDDGSTDEGAAIVSAYGDERIRLIQQANAGPGAARNRGIAASTASLVACLDGDDEWLPHFVETGVSQLAAHPDCEVFAGGQYRGEGQQNWEERWRNFGITAGVWRLPTKVKPLLLKPLIDYFHPSTVLLRRGTIERLGGYYDKQHCTYGEDTYLWLQVALHCRVYRDPAPVSWYHTECSEWGVWNRPICPPWPMLTDPEPMRQQCLPEYRELLEQYLGHFSVLAARRLAQGGDRVGARELLERFPLARAFGEEYRKANVEILLANFPELRAILGRAKLGRVKWGS